MKIVLIGFMGTGKSTVSKLLGTLLGLRVIETDQLICELAGVSCPRDVFDKFGEPHFRELEAQVAKSLADVNEVVISGGGGIITNPENIAALKANSAMLCYLQTEFDEIVRRCGSDSQRPLLKDKDYAKNLYNQRLPMYKEAADFTVVTDKISANEVAINVVAELNEKS